MNRRSATCTGRSATKRLRNGAADNAYYTTNMFMLPLQTFVPIKSMTCSPPSIRHIQISTNGDTMLLKPNKIMWTHTTIQTTWLTQIFPTTMAGTELAVIHNGSGQPGISVNALIMGGDPEIYIISYVNIPSPECAAKYFEIRRNCGRAHITQKGSNRSRL